MTDVEPADWDRFVEASDPGSYLQLSGWADRQGGERLVGAPDLDRSRRRTIRSAPRSSFVDPGRCRGASPTRRAARSPARGTRRRSGRFTAAVRDGLPATAGRVSHVRIDPEIEADGPLDPDGALRRGLTTAGWRSATPIQPNATRIIDLRADEDALWGDLRKKWRQYVNKARTGGIVVVDAGDERLGEFYRIYRETADRAGFLIRAESAYRDVWGAFAPTGNARLLFAQTADGDPQATLFLVRCGPRVVEPYGGMTAAGAESRANYLLKWEAIRSSREAGATSYDLWGLATGGIAHFKTGFGGREVRYIGAWDLVLSPRRASAPTSWRSARVSAGHAGAAGSPTAGARRPTEGPIERSRRGRRRAGRLGRGHRRGAWRPRPPVTGVGRASPRGRLAATLPRRRRRRSGAGARPVVAGRARRQRLPATRTRPDRRRAGGPRLRG